MLLLRLVVLLSNYFSTDYTPAVLHTEYVGASGKFVSLYGHRIASNAFKMTNCFARNILKLDI